MSSLGNVLACQQLFPREEGVDGVGLLPFLLSTLSPTENPCIKGSVQIQRLTVKNFTFYICENLVKQRAKNNFQHQKRPSQVLSYLCHCFRCIQTTRNGVHTNSIAKIYDRWTAPSTGHKRENHNQSLPLAVVSVPSRALLTWNLNLNLNLNIVMSAKSFGTSRQL